MKQSVKVNLYNILSDDIENGIRVGWNRAHKHTNTPDLDTIIERVRDAILENMGEHIEL